MTKKWEVPKLWPGETVAVLGNSPNMTQAMADSARASGYKTIAVNRAVRFAPWADMFVALDPHHPFWKDAETFAGLKVCGVECEIDALYAGMFYENVSLGEGHTIQIRNNALAAIRIAARLGAAKLILIGFDPPAYEAEHDFRGLVEGLDQMIVELRAQGIVVQRDPAPETHAPATV